MALVCHSPAEPNGGGGGGQAAGRTCPYENVFSADGGVTRSSASSPVPVRVPFGRISSVHDLIGTVPAAPS